MGNSPGKKQIKALKKLNSTKIPDLVKDRHVYARVIDCYDGDTCTIVFLLDKIPVKLKLRLSGIDTAEKPRRKDKSDRTPKEIELCDAALEFLSDRVLDKCVFVELERWGKWGGRVLGHLYCVNKKGEIFGESLSKQLLDAGLAVEYHGARKDTDWEKVYKRWKQN